MSASAPSPPPLGPPARVLVLGGGVAGLTAAAVFAQSGLAVSLVERAQRLGGHAARLSCKATTGCVHCGACLLEAALQAVRTQPRIAVHLGAVARIRRAAGAFSFELHPACGAGAGTAAEEVAAVFLATGFSPFSPAERPLGWGVFANVLTNLELEDRLRAEGRLTRPSDGRVPGRIAFIQCVGSRNAQIGHLWCSAFCCAAALRAARKIRHLHPETEITIFYIDLQSVGRTPDAFLEECRRSLRLIRAVPGEALGTEDGGVRLAWFDDTGRKSLEETFDLVVLSAGMRPPDDLAETLAPLGLARDGFGFAAEEGERVFAAGAVRRPMTIAEAIADSRRAARRLLAALGCGGPPCDRTAGPVPPAGGAPGEIPPGPHREGGR